MTLFTLLLSQSKYKSCQLRCPLQGRGKESRTGTRTADTNYLSNWSKCSQKCHLLKDQLITSSCSPNRLTKKKKKKSAGSLQNRPPPPFIFGELCNLMFVSFVLCTIDEALSNIYYKTCCILLEIWTFKSWEQTCDLFPLPNQIWEP